MEPNEIDSSSENIISSAIVFLVISIIYLHRLPTIWAFIVCILFAGASIACILGITVWSSTNRIEHRVRKRLHRKGYQTEMTEGDLFVTKNENQYRVHLVESFNKRIKTLFIIYEFGDDRFNKISMDGWCRASNSINNHHPGITFVTLDDHFFCYYLSAIANSKDFMKEFFRACYFFEKVLDDYSQLTPYLERDYPNKEESQTSIGFKQS